MEQEAFELAVDAQVCHRILQGVDFKAPANGQSHRRVPANLLERSEFRLAGPRPWHETETQCAAWVVAVL